MYVAEKREISAVELLNFVAKSVARLGAGVNLATTADAGCASLLLYVLIWALNTGCCRSIS